MGRNLRNDSKSPVRDHGSPSRRSPSRRSPSRKSQSRTEKSPTRERKSHRGSSPPREKHSSRPKSPKHARSPSPPPRSPSPRSKRLRRAEAERVSGREHDPKHARSPSPPPRSPSPRTKRLRRAEAERVSGREHETTNDKGIGRDLQEGGSERDVRSDRKEKSSGRNDTDDKSSRSRRGTSPSDQHRRSRHRSRSPQHAGDTRDGDKVSEGRGRNHSRGSDKSMHREKDSDRENETERMERRTAKDSSGHRSSRSRHEKSTSPLNGHHKNRHRNHSPQQDADTRARDEVPDSREAEDGIDENDSVAMMKAAEEALETKKQKPSFELSGKLAAETNRFRGITLLYTEPAEAREPKVRWRLYVFKGGEVLNEPLKIHRQSCYLFGRERRVADIPTDHPSCSKQHAVIQFREVEKEQPDGMMSKEVKPYIMDLGSTNKTFVNESAIEPQRYYELMERDTIKFGNSSREYVLLHENSMD